MFVSLRSICSWLSILDSSSKQALGPQFVVVTPGIRLADPDAKSDDQKRVATPFEAVRNGADYIVVGRPIREAPDPLKAARAIAEEVEKGLKERKT